MSKWLLERAVRKKKEHIVKIKNMLKQEKELLKELQNAIKNHRF